MTVLVLFIYDEDISLFHLCMSTASIIKAQLYEDHPDTDLRDIFAGRHGPLLPFSGGSDNTRDVELCVWSRINYAYDRIIAVKS